MDECKEVLKSFSSGKSPGEDGFTWEFYNCFFDLLGEDLINCYNAAYKTGEMSISQRRGTITLIPKEDSNLLNLANWRPITLLNLDYKIASKNRKSTDTSHQSRSNWIYKRKIHRSKC